MKKETSALAGAAIVFLSATAVPAQQFRQGECSGILCSTIGGSQAPQNQPRKSLFPEGECGGILCSAIGGSQAPKPVGPPPACGGGLLCDVAPYSVGQPFITPEEAERRRRAAAAIPAQEPSPSKAAIKRQRKSKIVRQSATAN